MGPNDTTMAGLRCWVSAAEMKEPPKFDPSRLRAGTGVPGWWVQDGYLFRESDGMWMRDFGHPLGVAQQIADFESIEAPGINKPLGPEWQAAFADEADASARLALTPEEGEWPARDRVPRASSVATMDQDAAVAVRDAAYWRSSTNGAKVVPPMIGLRPAEVTPEMIESGEEADFGHSSEVRYPAIYRAMHAVAPVPLVSDAEIALTKERDEARAERDAALAWDRAGDETISTLRDELDDARAEVASFHGLYEQHRLMAREVMNIRAELDKAREDRDAHERQLTVTENRVFELKAELAKFTAQSAAESGAPDPIANAIRDHGSDRRMVGR